MHTDSLILDADQVASLRFDPPVADEDAAPMPRLRRPGAPPLDANAGEGLVAERCPSPPSPPTTSAGANSSDAATE